MKNRRHWLFSATSSHLLWWGHAFSIKWNLSSNFMTNTRAKSGRCLFFSILSSSSTLIERPDMIHYFIGNVSRPKVALAMFKRQLCDSIDPFTMFKCRTWGNIIRISRIDDYFNSILNWITKFNQNLWIVSWILTNVGTGFLTPKTLCSFARNSRIYKYQPVECRPLGLHSAARGKY